MVRKTLYALIGISLVLVMNQVITVNGTAATVATGATPIATNVMTGSVEVRLMASPTAAEVTAADVTISSVEIYLASGWSKMNMGNTNTVDLKQVVGSEQTIATTTNLNPGTYTQIRMTITRVDVTLQGNQPKKASLSYSKLTFVQNFTVTAKNTTVLVINFNPIGSIDDTNKNQITFNPVANLLYTAPGSMQIATTNPPQAEVGVAYYAKLIAIGGQRPYTWSITMGDPPAGLNFDAATGIISGTPTRAGNFGFTVRVDDSSPTRKNTTRNYTIGVAVEGALQIVTGSLPDGSQEGVYKVTLQSIGGTQSYTWSLSAGNLPTGLSLDASTGVISGTATVPGNFSFVAKVTDSANPANTDNQILSIYIGKEVLSK